MTGTFYDRFWARVDVRKQDECWPWIGATKTHSGHGVVPLKNPGQLATTTTAHRVAWALNFGPIPDGQYVLHSCDNPPCCNPRHLWLGTQKDNLHDMAAKGRGHWQRERGVPCVSGK